MIGPVAQEFLQITDGLKLGGDFDDVLWSAAERINLPEFNFFVITLTIQRETGGNLGETLENLTDMLRKRRQVKLKVKALSSEAKASAIIIGSSAGAGGGVGAAIGGKKGALIGAAIGGGGAALWDQITRRDR